MANYPKSDHYDGSSFFNPSNPAGNGMWAGLKMMTSLKFEMWPESIQNSTAPDLNQPLTDDQIAITFVNHATVLVQSKEFNFLTDPVWSDRVSPVSWAGPKRHRPPGIPFEKLPKIDFVVISHNHYDHMDVATLKKLNEAFHPHFLVPLGNKKFLEDHGMEKVSELDWWQSLDLPTAVKVSLAPAEHFSNRGVFDKNKTLWGSFVISFRGHTLYFGGDTAYSPHFMAIRERFGRPDIAFLPIGAYDPRWFMKVVHMNPEEAVQAHMDLGAVQSIGIHFGTFQLTEEAIDQPVKDLNVALTAQNISASQFVTLPEGQTQVYNLTHPDSRRNSSE